MKMTAHEFLEALKAVDQTASEMAAVLVSTVSVDPKQLAGCEDVSGALAIHFKRVTDLAALKTPNGEDTGNIAATAIAFALGRTAGLAHVAGGPTLSQAIDDIASIAFGDGYDSGSGCSKYNATQAWDNFKQHSLPILKQRIHGMPVQGYVQVPIESAKFCANKLLGVLSSLFLTAEESGMATRYRTHINALLMPVESVEAQENDKGNQNA